MGFSAGVGLPYIEKLNSTLLISLIILLLTSSIGIYFLRETKSEMLLFNYSSEITGLSIEENRQRQLTTVTKNNQS